MAWAKAHSAGAIDLAGETVACGAILAAELARAEAELASERPGGWKKVREDRYVELYEGALGALEEIASIARTAKCRGSISEGELLHILGRAESETRAAIGHDGKDLTAPGPHG